METDIQINVRSVASLTNFPHLDVWMWLDTETVNYALCVYLHGLN